MSRQLFTSWGDFQAAIDQLLTLAQRKILIYDGDLSGLKLDTTQRVEELKRLLLSAGPDCLRIALRDASPLRREGPRLMELLTSNAPGMSVLETPEQLSHLRDSMILVDDRHGLILFDRDQPRSKLLFDEIEELEPYLRRFQAIWDEGGTPVSPTILGL